MLSMAHHQLEALCGESRVEATFDNINIYIILEMDLEGSSEVIYDRS